MSVGLINWSGHNNLGDDAMAEILMSTITRAVNMGEKVEDADWYIFGGGTLITPSAMFLDQLKKPEKTIGISLGVSSNWNGEHVDILKRFKRLYVRDNFSHNKLKEFGVDSILSVDLLCANKKFHKIKHSGTAVNVLYTNAGTHTNLEEEVDKVLKYTVGCKQFALSPDEDLDAMPKAEVFTDANKLLKLLSGHATVYATRLHANVIAWMAECPDIKPIAYDAKIDHFYQRVKNITPFEANFLIKQHLKDICQLVN